MRNVTLRQLRIFSAVARELSFTRAAKELHLTQPAVSQQIKLLEAEVGLPLFEHVGRTFHLTPAGTEMLLYANQALDLMREAGEALAAVGGVRRGVLKLGAVSTAKYFAPSLLAAFTASYPQVTIKFPVGNREDIIGQLGANEIDLAIMGRPPRELETVAEPFAKHPFVIVAAPSHPLVGKRRIPLKRLADERFLIRESGSGTRASMEHVFREHGAGFHTYMEVSSTETIKQAVIAGMGISFISLHTVGLELKTGRLAMLNVVGLPLVRDWYVIYMKEKRLWPIATAFRAFLLEHGASLIQDAVGFDTPRQLRRGRP
jgi:LysR family transcriptional regulator, low CO2-responsive transcriptional regulator